VIMQTDTIVDPWAMMVKSLDTSVARSTVARARRADSQALRA